MDKKNFWRGFVTGSILFILLTILVYNKFVVQPDISLNQVEVQDLNGQKVDLKTYVGKPLVVNYWATWCAPCLQEFPYFSEIQGQMKNDVNFVMISDEIQNKVTRFSKSNSYGFTYLISTKNLGEYGITTRPTTYFYNANGELVSKHVGSIDNNTLKKLISKIK